MKLGFEESQSSYASGSQNARTWTEAWVSAWAYCPHCGNAKISSFPNNSPLADFFCTSCSEEFELKSQKGKFGAKVLDGEFKTKCERLAASNNPNLLLMNYDLKSRAVVNLFIVPKHFLRPRDHRGAQTTRCHGTSCWVEGLENPAQSCSRVGKNPHRSRRCRSGKRSGPSRMAKDAFP